MKTLIMGVLGIIFGVFVAAEIMLDLVNAEGPSQMLGLSLTLLVVLYCVHVLVGTAIEVVRILRSKK